MHTEKAYMKVTGNNNNNNNKNMMSLPVPYGISHIRALR